MIWVPVWDQVAGIRDLDGKIFSVKQHTTFNHQEESRILKMSRKYQNPLWQEYTAASKYEQGYREAVPWKKVISLCFTIVLPDPSVVPVQSINLYKEKHIFLAQVFLPAGTKPFWSLPTDHHLQQHFTTKWQNGSRIGTGHISLDGQVGPDLQFVRYRTSPHTLLPRASLSARTLKGRC